MIQFKEFLAQKLIRTELFRMAYKRQKAIEKVMKVSDELVDNIIKLSLFPDHANVTYWKSEIDYCMGHINCIKLKPNNTKLKYSELYEDLFDGPIEDVEGLRIRINHLLRDGNISHIPENIEYHILFKNIHYLYKTLCQDLSEDKYCGFEYYLNMLKD